MFEFTAWRAPSTGKTVLPLLINMSGADARLNASKQHFDSLHIPFNRVEAVIGRDIQFPIPQFSELSYKLLHGRRMVPAEVGCYLSHVKAAEILLNTDHDYALICEDDVHFFEDILSVIDSALTHEKDWDILRLTTVNNDTVFPYKAISAKHHLAISLMRKKGAGAYIVNRKAAKWIAEKLLPIRVAYDIAFDLEYFAGLKAAFVHPLPAHQSRASDTQIQNNIRSYKLPKWRYFTVLPYRAWLEISRVIFRAPLLAYYTLRDGRFWPRLTKKSDQRAV